MKLTGKRGFQVVENAAECALLLCRKSLKERRTAGVAHSKLERFVGILHRASCMLILCLGSR